MINTKRMVSFNQIKPFLAVAFAYFIYQTLIVKKHLEYFVPSNSFEPPTNLSPEKWQALNDKFGRLIQLVNTTTFDVSYQLDNIIDTFTTILNNVGVGKYVVLSVGETKQFTLMNVLVQDISTLAVTKFARVDFIVASLDPFSIHKVIITPDGEFKTSQTVLPRDPMKPEMFRIQNPLHLFHPHHTSVNEMALTKNDVENFNKKLENLNALNQTVKNVTVYNANAPVPSQLSPKIVGAGPLHPLML